MAELFAVGQRRLGVADLQEIELLRNLDTSDFELLAKEAVPLKVAPGQIVFHEGEPAEAFYLILDGTFVAFRDAVGQPVHLIARLCRGDFFGELGLLTGGRYVASVRASESGELLRIASEPLFAILHRHPDLHERLQATSSARYSHLVATALELGRRREVRIKCSERVGLRLEDGRVVPALLENLSLGGACIGGVPGSWHHDTDIRFGLQLLGHELELAGRVTWHMGDKAGVAFTPLDEHHDARIQMVIRILLHSRPERAP